MDVDDSAQGNFPVEDVSRGGDAAADDLELVYDLHLATSSDEDGSMHHRFGRQRVNDLNADSDAAPLGDADAREPPSAGPRQHAKRKKPQAFQGRRRRVSSQAKPKTNVDDDDELLLDCVLARQPHATPESSQRVKIWQAIADEIKAMDAPRLGQYSASGLSMRLGFLVKAFKNPLHRQHTAVQGSLRAKLAEYSDSLLPTMSLPPPPRRKPCAAADHTSEDDSRDGADDDGADGSEASDVEMVFHTSASRASSRGGRDARTPPKTPAQTMPRLQASTQRHARASRGESQPRCGRDQTASRVGGTATAAATPTRKSVAPASSAMLAELMHQADRARREHYDVGVLLARQTDAVLQQNSAVLEQNRRYLEQNQARMDDHREWRARCLSLLALQSTPRASGGDPSDSEGA